MKVTLLEVFKDFEVTVKGYGQFGRYVQLFKLVPIQNANTVTVEDLENYVKSLQQRYPDKNFYLDKRVLNGKVFYIVTKKKRMPNGRQVYDRIPVYFDLENQKVYVPKSYVKKQRRLTNYILMRVLGALGVARQYYVRTEGRR
ncbi:MAG: hypothetical protein QXH10_09265 [Ignisphaera sp.]|uniref:Uncharacterized protein n=1 Tax=Ligamenvirales sp. TaxID=2832923 RepID=A0AAU6PX58_9VIRU